MGKTLKQKLLNGDVTIGSWITLSDPSIAEIMSNAGFDWLTIDLEHSPLTLEQAVSHIRTISLSGVTALVRLTSNNSDQIKRVMDSGAHGIIVPMVNSADEAKRAVDAIYYPPRGTRGVGLARAQDYGAGFQDYINWLDNEAICIVQIEHIDAVENAADIFSVEGVDGYILGPYDLSASMGLAGQLEHKEVKSAMQRVKEVAQITSCPGGLHVVEPDPHLINQVIDQGFTFNAFSVDMRMLDEMCRSAISQVKS